MGYLEGLFSWIPFLGSLVRSLKVSTRRCATQVMCASMMPCANKVHHRSTESILEQSKGMKLLDVHYCSSTSVRYKPALQAAIAGRTAANADLNSSVQSSSSMWCKQTAKRTCM